MIHVALSLAADQALSLTVVSIDVVTRGRGGGGGGGGGDIHVPQPFGMTQLLMFQTCTDVPIEIALVLCSGEDTGEQQTAGICQRWMVYER